MPPLKTNFAEGRMRQDKFKSAQKLISDIEECMSKEAASSTEATKQINAFFSKLDDLYHDGTLKFDYDIDSIPENQDDHKQFLNESKTNYDSLEQHLKAAVPKAADANVKMYEAAKELLAELNSLKVVSYREGDNRKAGLNQVLQAVEGFKTAKKEHSKSLENLFPAEAQTTSFDNLRAEGKYDTNTSELNSIYRLLTLNKIDASNSLAPSSLTSQYNLEQFGEDKTRKATADLVENWNEISKSTNFNSKISLLDTSVMGEYTYKEEPRPEQQLQDISKELLSKIKKEITTDIKEIDSSPTTGIG